MGLITAYLFAYNVASMAGWALVWYLTATAAQSNTNPTDCWATIEQPLMIVQFAALLEVFHSAFGFVRSPLSSTFIQVMSRVVVLGVYTYQSVASQAHWSLYLMVLSWASVEVPRYMFYAVNLIPALSGDKMPYVLFFLRYSLFMVLYPTGISGELYQIYNALPFWGETYPLVERLSHLLLAMYVPLGPYMVMNMWGMRKRAMKKRSGAKAPPRPLDGVVWPVTDEAKNLRASTATNKQIWAASIAAVDKDAAAKISKARNWRFGYPKFIEFNVRKSAESPENALAVANAGIREAQTAFHFVREGKETTLREAMDTIKGSFETGFIKGNKPKPAEGFDLLVPYKNTILQGANLKQQLDTWVENGTIEPSAANAIKLTAANRDWLDLSDRYFVLLGATSAMGPLDTLLGLGANIIAIDLDRPQIWKTLITKARNSCGSLTFPLSKSQSEISNDEELFACAGSNLLGKTPEIANWLTTVCPGKALTIGNYTYLDGALHVQLSVASDVIMDKVCAARKDTSVAFLCTPTDTHLVPKEAHDQSKENLKASKWWLKIVSALAGKRALVPNAIPPVKKSGLYLVDGIAAAQGPNYALAKRLQHWRAMVARDAGHIASSNVAPSTATKSVVSNAQFAAAYGGFHHFKALEVFYQETSGPVMNALLIHDLNNPDSAANPKTKLENPLQLFSFGSCHGGAWRVEYKFDSIGVTAACAYYFARYWFSLFGALVFVANVVVYLLTGELLLTLEKGYPSFNFCCLDDFMSHF